MTTGHIKGGDALAQTLVAHDVTTVFSLAGTAHIDHGDDLTAGVGGNSPRIPPHSVIKLLY